MTKSYQWYYNGSAIGGATGKTHTLTTGQDDSSLIECRSTVTYGSDGVSALAKWTQTQEVGTQLLTRGRDVDGVSPWVFVGTMNRTASDSWNSPLGGTLGDTISNGGSLGAELRQTYTFSAATVYNFSVYVGKTKNQWNRLRIDTVSVWFDCTNGSIGTTEAGASNVAISDEGNAYRISMEVTPGAVASTVRLLLTEGDGSGTEPINATLDVDGFLLTEGTGLKAYPV